MCTVIKLQGVFEGYWVGGWQDIGWAWDVWGEWGDINPKYQILADSCAILTS